MTHREAAALSDAGKLQQVREALRELLRGVEAITYQGNNPTNPLVNGCVESTDLTPYIGEAIKQAKAALLTTPAEQEKLMSVEMSDGERWEKVREVLDDTRLSDRQVMVYIRSLLPPIAIDPEERARDGERRIYPLSSQSFLAAVNGNLYWGEIRRQPPNDQSKLCIDWRDMNWPGDPLPYSEESES